MTSLSAPEAAMDPSGRTLTIRIPLQLRRIGGRKAIIAPDSSEAWAPVTSEQSGALVKAVVRAFRWQQLLDRGVYLCIDELANAEKINPSYVSRILRLNLLAPDIIQAILDGRHEDKLTMPALLKPMPYSWHAQWDLLGLGARRT